MTDALIHLRVPAELKARWVRESRAVGMRLTDWIAQRVAQTEFKEWNMNKNAVVLWWHLFGGETGEKVTTDLSMAERGEELFKGTAAEAEELRATPVAHRWAHAQEIMHRCPVE